MVRVDFEDICDIVHFSGNNDTYTLSIIDKEDMKRQTVHFICKGGIWTLVQGKESIATTGDSQFIGGNYFPHSTVSKWEKIDGKINQEFYLEYLKGIYEKIN